MAEKSRALSKNANVSFDMTRSEKLQGKDKTSLLKSMFSKAISKSGETSSKLKTSTQRWMGDVGAGITAFRNEYAARVSQRNFDKQVALLEQQGYSVVNTEAIQNVMNLLAERATKNTTGKNVIHDIREQLESAFSENIGINSNKQQNRQKLESSFNSAVSIDNTILHETESGKELATDVASIKSSKFSIFKNLISKRKGMFSKPFTTQYCESAIEKLETEMVVSEPIVTEITSKNVDEVESESKTSETDTIVQQDVPDVKEEVAKDVNNKVTKTSVKKNGKKKSNLEAKQDDVVTKDDVKKVSSVRKTKVSDIKSNCDKLAQNSMNVQFETILNMLKMQAELPPQDRDFRGIAEAMAASSKMMQESLESKSSVSTSTQKTSPRSRNKQNDRVAKAAEIVTESTYDDGNLPFEFDN